MFFVQTTLIAFSVMIWCITDVSVLFAALFLSIIDKKVLYSALIWLWNYLYKVGLPHSYLYRIRTSEPKDFSKCRSSTGLVTIRDSPGPPPPGSCTLDCDWLSGWVQLTYPLLSPFFSWPHSSLPKILREIKYCQFKISTTLIPLRVITVKEANH